MITADAIRELVQRSLPDAEVRLRDLTGGGDHWEATVISAAFEGRSLVEQHQLVYAALRPQMVSEIHALQLKTGTPSKTT